MHFTTLLCVLFQEKFPSLLGAKNWINSLFVRVLQRHRSIGYVYLSTFLSHCLSRLFRKKLIIRNWLMPLWQLASHKTCRASIGTPRGSDGVSSSPNPKAGAPGEPVVWFQSEEWQAWELGRADVSASIGKHENSRCPSPKAVRQEEFFLH